jgi:PKD repeat protein
MALHPNFPATPYVYVLYTYDGDIGGAAPKYGTAGATSDPGPDATGAGAKVSGRLSRLTASGNVATGGETVLIHDWAQQFPSHSIGSLQFGPDGALYASGGDGASFNYADYGQTDNPFGDPGGPAGSDLTPPTAEGGALRSQDLLSPGDPTTLDGSIVRIDPETGAALPGNPLYSTGNDANARRVVAEGLRNPFRFAVRPGTSELWIGDVGWGTWEEINRVVAPTAPTYTNFGWPAYEGAARQSGYDGANLTLLENFYNNPSAHTAPHYAYNHSAQVVPGSGEPTGGSAISGMAFYAGGTYPGAYDGALFFSDYSRDRIYVMYKGPSGDPDPNNRAMFVGPAQNPVNLEIGPGGDLFYVDLAGSIRRITFATSNRTPTAVAAASPTSGPAPLTVSFDATGSSDPDGDALSYAWDFDNDGQYDDSTAAQPSHTFTGSGNVMVGLRVSDGRGASDTDSIVISVDNTAPAAAIDQPLTGARWKVGDMISFAGHASDTEDGTVAASGLSWSLVLLHGTAGTPGYHEHFVQSFPGVASGSFVAPDHEYPSKLQLRLTATDSGGLSNTAVVDLEPLTVDLTLQSSPAGLTLTLNGTGAATPFTRPVIVGSNNSVSAPSPQSLSGTSYNFSNWSDGGAATHNLTAPEGATTYTATYTAAPPPPPAGLVAAYGFEEGSGTVAGDSSGTGNHGTISGATWTTAGKFGKALYFDGVNDTVSIADSSSLDLVNMTLEAWVRPASVSRATNVLFKERGKKGLAYAMYASNGTNLPPAGYVYRNGNVSAVGPSALPVNTWTHLATAYDGSALRLYVNGTLAATRAVTGAPPATANALRIGGNAIWGEYFSGLIDEVRVYNRALSQSEVQADMNAAVPGGAATATTATSSVAPSTASLEPAGAGAATRAAAGVLEVDESATNGWERKKHRKHRRHPRLSLADAGAVRVRRSM